MNLISNHSNEYYLAKSKAQNVLFFCKFNNGMYEKDRVHEEHWRDSSKLYQDGSCYMLIDCVGSYHRWST